VIAGGRELVDADGVFDPLGARVLTASTDSTARLWDAATGAELRVLRGHENSVLSAVFDPSGARVLTTSHDRTARVWRVFPTVQAVTALPHPITVSIPKAISTGAVRFVRAVASLTLSIRGLGRHDDDRNSARFARDDGTCQSALKHDCIVTGSPGAQENWSHLRDAARRQPSAPRLLITGAKEGSNQPRTLTITG
jgi:WD40 repeat protein